MNRKKIRIILIISIIIMSITIAIIITKLFKIYKNKAKEDIVEYSWVSEDNLKLQELKNNSEYYVLKDCIDDFILSVLNENINNTYLDEWYLNNNYQTKITKNLLNGYTTYEPDKIQYILKDNIYIYYVYGNIVIDEGSSPNIEYNLIVKLDYTTYKYSIIPEIIENIHLEKEIFNKITEEKYPSFNIKSIPNVQIGNRYIEKLFLEIFSNIDNSYELIDEEYKEKKFSKDIENYKKYIKNYFNYSVTPIAKDCKQFITDDYTIFLVTDSYKNNYIIKETSVNQIKVCLDRYTVPIEVIEQQYNENYTDKDKVRFNAENIIDSLRKENYEYTYNHISTENKKDNIATLELYKSYMSKNSLKDFNIKSNNIKINQENNYIYTAYMNNAKNNTEKRIEITMQLKEETNFTISIKIYDT